jgi:hypothetical protein
MLAIWRDSLCAPQKIPFGAIQPLRAIKRLIWRDSLLRAIRPCPSPIAIRVVQRCAFCDLTNANERFPAWHNAAQGTVGE